MRLNEIEAWAIRVIGSASKGLAYEDSRIELKAELPEPARVARRIAGHANSAQSEEILWLVGVDEKDGIVGAKAKDLDLARWWPQTEACFDGAVPQLTEVVVHLEEQMVLCLLFRTDRAPYLVKNSAGGEIQREVPWRDGTRIRTAKREDLLRILAPLVPKPKTETVSAYIRPSDGTRTKFMGGIRIFVTIPEGSSITIPLHRCQGGLFLNGEELMHFSSILGNNHSQFGGVGDQVSLKGPSVLHLQIEGNIREPFLDSHQTVELKLRLGFASDTPDIEIIQALDQRPDDKAFFQFGSLR